MTRDPLTERLALWRKRASTGSYVDGAVRDVYGRPRPGYTDAIPGALPDIGDETDPCPSCGTPLVVIARTLTDKLLVGCPTCRFTENFQ